MKKLLLTIILTIILFCSCNHHYETHKIETTVISKHYIPTTPGIRVNKSTNTAYKQPYYYAVVHIKNTNIIEREGLTKSQYDNIRVGDKLIITRTILVQNENDR